MIYTVEIIHPVVGTSIVVTANSPAGAAMQACKQHDEGAAEMELANSQEVICRVTNDTGTCTKVVIWPVIEIDYRVMGTRPE